VRTGYIIAGIVILGTLVTAEAQRVGDVVTISQTQSSDEYVAGRSVRISTAIEGDLVVAGQEIVVDGPVGGDLIAAGDTLTILQAIGDDARMAGRIIVIESSVSGHLVAGGDEIELASSASVEEWVWLAGRSLSLNGRVGGELRAAGERVFVNGTVDGDAVITAEHIEIAETSVIRGDLIVRSKEDPVIAPGATIEGETIREGLPGRSSVVSGVTDSLYSSVAVIIAAIAVYLLFSGFSVSVTSRTRAAPLQSLGIGLGVAILTPIVIIVLFVTGIGYLLGLGALAAYLLALLVGSLFGLISVSGIGLGLIMGPDRASSRLIQSLAVGVGVIVLLLLSQIPILGSVLLIAVGVGGLGALMTELWRRYRFTPS
jgi:cytoskeletal protein CcmA (bactofilin family)